MAADNETFVKNLFSELYYRTPTTAELTFYASRLESGFYTRSQVASIFMQSPEYKGGIESITRLYQASFDRNPDYGGLMYWNGVMSKGASLSDIANIFFYSPEFVARYGANLSNAQFVEILYKNVLDRLPDAGGAAYWTKVLTDGTGRGQILASFAQSEELKQKLAIETKMMAAYAVIAERAPYPDELSSAPSTLDDILIKALSSVSSKLTWSASTLSEAALNDGSITNTLNVTLAGGTFKGAAGASLGTVSNVPAGLTASLVKVSDTLATLTLTGKATTHTTASSISNLTVTFAPADFASGGLPYNATKSDLRVDFKDMFAYVRSGTLSIAIAPTAALVIDLTTDTIRLGKDLITPLEGTMVAAVNADLSAIPTADTSTSTTTSGTGTGTSTGTGTTGTGTTTTVSVSFKAGPENNIYLASPLGDTITGGGGNDTITLGDGADTIVMPANPDAGVVTIKGFETGDDGDVLKVSGFLTKLDISDIDPIDTNLTPTAARDWNNGDVVLVIGNLDSEDIVDLFGTHLANPTTAAKLVILSADVMGNTKVWFVTNFSGSGVVGGSETNFARIALNEVTLVGVLEDINNLALAGFEIGNFG